MSPFFNSIMLLVFVGAMAYQATRAPSHSYRRRSFAVAAGAFGLLALFNAKAALQGEPGPWFIAVMALFAVLLFISLVLLLVAWRKGEMQPQVDRARQAVKDERIRRGRDDERR